jgi:hypothetical protein
MSDSGPIYLIEAVFLVALAAEEASMSVVSLCNRLLAHRELDKHLARFKDMVITLLTLLADARKRATLVW